MAGARINHGGVCMNNKKFVITIFSVFTLFFTAYRGQALETSNYTIIHVSDEISITISYVTDEFLAQYETFIEFSQHGGDPRRRGIAFVSNVLVKNFRYIRINGAEIMFIIEEDLFFLDELLPETPLLVDWIAMGSMAYGGFALEDENSVTRYFAFNYDAAGYTAFRFREFEGGLTLDYYAP